jgi:OFA family oxalate/formate antiporter-like MFS transporter
VHRRDAGDSNLQYAWTFFTTDITKALHARLDAVQWTLTFFIIAQTVLFPINAYLVDRFGPRIIVTFASVLVALAGSEPDGPIPLPPFMRSYALGGDGRRRSLRRLLWAWR